jgi:putative acetyltransferase
MPDTSQAAATVRAARPDDAEAMVAAHFAAVRSIRAGVYPPTVLLAWSPTPNAARHAWMREQIRGGRFLALVAERDGAVGGFALCRADEGVLQALYVDPRHAGHGLGRALLAACEAGMRAAGHASARVQASLNAEAFYLAAGYRSLGAATQPLADGTLLACIEMRKPLGRG